MKEIKDEQALQDVLCLGRSLGVHDVEGQRILQVSSLTFPCTVMPCHVSDVKNEVHRGQKCIAEQPSIPVDK